MEDRKVLLSVKDLEVKFRVRGRILTAIRGINLDIYENESIAIVGESGSGKSVFTKTFAGMLETNGFISNGSVIFNDDELADTKVTLNGLAKLDINRMHKKLNSYSKLEKGAETYRKMLELKRVHKAKETLSDEEDENFTKKLDDLRYQMTEAINLKQTLDPKHDKEQIHQVSSDISRYQKEIKETENERDALIKEHKAKAAADSAYQQSYEKELSELKAQYEKETAGEVSKEISDRNLFIAREIYLSIGRYNPVRRTKTEVKLLKSFKEAMRLGEDVGKEEIRDAVFGTIALRVKLMDISETQLHGTVVLNVANISNPKDWQQIRGSKIATVFQDPMTSLNPIITIGKQITSVIIKHQKCSEVEARQRALKLMKQVGIPNAENRFDDYPFQYSGGMRQRIVIAIALSCQPKILICDEPTTALDVTIQAQILQLLKDLQKEYSYTIVFITHDLGVVANIAERVAVLYAGQIVELGNVDEIFYEPQHPYTWALLSSLPQLAEKGSKLYFITGTPPSLYNKVTGDAFAPRNPYCLKIDTIEEPPMFKISDTHYAKTWILDPRAPKVEKPEIIQNIHEKLMKSLNM